MNWQQKLGVGGPLVDLDFQIKKSYEEWLPELDDPHDTVARVSEELGVSWEDVAKSLSLQGFRI